MNEWKSSVLKCDPHEDGCRICGFLSGDRDMETLMEVIRTLDIVCEREETDRRTYMELFFGLAAKNI
jgi:hypothetical protein